jgi:hypothetical protein
MANEFVVKNGAITPNLKLTGSTSGTITVLATATAGSNTLTLPAVTGTAVTTGDTGSVTNTMLAGSIANAKLTNSSITVNGSSISLGGSATITASNPNALTISTGLSGTSYNGSSAVTIAIDSTVATLTGIQTLTNKTLTSPAVTTSLTTGSTTFNLLNTTATTINIGGAATAISIGSTAHTGTTTIENNLYVTGSITFGGGSTQLSATELVINDPLIYIGDNNVADITDLGIVGAYNTGTHLHTGLVRDASDNGIWKLFSGMVGEPTGSTLDFTSVTYAPLKVGSLTSTIATGTAPLTVTSTTLVSNLNSDYLDGQHGSYYTTAGNLTGTISNTVLGNSTNYIGTTSVTLNRASANLALTGISSVTLPGSTSGTVQLVPTAAVGTGTILTIPAVTGTIVTTGDTSSVTNTMLAGSIAITKLVSSTISGISLGSNLNALTIGTGLSGTTYNGSAGVTIAIDTATTVDKTTAQTLTNKSLSDSTTYFIDETDGTKKLQFQLSSITTATTRTLSVPDVSGTIITTGDTGTVTSTMIAEGTIVNGDISISAAIAVSKLAASTISGISLGSNLNALTISAPLTGTSYNGSGAVSIGIPAATTSASGYLTSTDWNTFNGKYSTGGALGTPSSGTLTNCTFPTLNQNTTGSSASCTGNAATATTATNQSGGTVTSYGNSSFNFTHGQNLKVGLPAGNNGAANGDAYLYLWASEPAATWTAGGIARNRSNSSGSFPRVNTTLTGQMMRFDEGTGIAFSSIDTAGTTFSPLSMAGNNISSAGSISGTNITAGGNVTGSSASCTGNAATATASQNATFLTQPNATWGAKIQLGGNGAGSGVANIATVQATDGNIHIDGGVGKVMYLNYYNNGTIYLNGGTYQISSNGSQYNGNAATATSADNIDGIAFKNSSSSSSFAVDTQGTNGIGYSTGYSLFGQTDGGVYCSTHDASWQHQINGDFRTGQIAVRGKNSGTWQSWRTVLDSGNYTSYSPTLTGGSASGSWGISVTGSSASCTGNAATATTASQLTGAAPNGVFRYTPNLHFNSGATAAVYLNWDNGTTGASNTLVIGNGGGGAIFTVTAQGTVVASGNITAFSDKRHKTNILKIDNALEKVKKLNGYTFDRTDMECDRQTGVIAQEVLEVLPEAVIGSEDTNYSVAYGNMVGLLIEAIKEQQVQIDELKELINKGN